MLPDSVRSRSQHLTRAQAVALDAIAGVVVGHINDERVNRPPGASAPVLIQVDGPGHDHLVDTTLRRLVKDGSAQPRTRVWTVVRFDAWQYQRVAPPWWWLLHAVDRQLRIEFRERGRSVHARKAVRDYLWRTAKLLTDLAPVLPLILLALALWYLTGRAPMDQYLKWIVGVLGALTTLGALLWSVGNAVRRLLVASPINAGASSPTNASDGRLPASVLLPDPIGRRSRRCRRQQSGPLPGELRG